MNVYIDSLKIYVHLDMWSLMITPPWPTPYCSRCFQIEATLIHRLSLSIDAWTESLNGTSTQQLREDTDTINEPVVKLGGTPLLEVTSALQIERGCEEFTSSVRCIFYAYSSPVPSTMAPLHHGSIAPWLHCTMVPLHHGSIAGEFV